MKTLRLIAVSFVFAAVFAVSVFAQTTAPTGKIALIDTRFFDNGKDGITKFVNAMNALETEFKPDFTALQTMGNRIKTLQTEIQTLQKQIDDGKVPVDEKSATAIVEEYDKLTREYKFKEEDFKARYQRREQVVTAPIRQDIGKALDEFAKKNGFSLILDGAKLDGAGLILAFDEKSDVTKEFITFYNARPATAATTANK
jgi:Skp family chaperone for outer membrane proteins